MATIDNIVLSGVGKKIRNGFLNGTVSREKLIQVYNHNKKESAAFSTFGMTIVEMRSQLHTCNNPIIKKILEDAIDSFEKNQELGKNQNEANFTKLDIFKSNALGVGLRRVISAMKKAAKKTKDKYVKVITLLLETEFANLCAKKCSAEKRKIIYERKTLLLQKISDLLYGSEWRYGYNSHIGKNASYLIYIYLPNGEQLTWHSNDYNVIYDFPYIEAKWDGQVASTMTKILDFIGLNYNNIIRAAS